MINTADAFLMIEMVQTAYYIQEKCLIAKTAVRDSGEAGGV